MNNIRPESQAERKLCRVKVHHLFILFIRVPLRLFYSHVGLSRGNKEFETRVLNRLIPRRLQMDVVGVSLYYSPPSKAPDIQTDRPITSIDCLKLAKSSVSLTPCYTLHTLA